MNSKESKESTLWILKYGLKLAERVEIQYN